MGDVIRRAAAAEAELWLRGGGRVVAASERAARAVAAGFHRARRAEGLAAWPAPQIDTWTGFVQSAWEARIAADDRLVMSATQEQELWIRIIEESRHGARLLFEGPRHRMAKMAADAHSLLCAYAPKYLKQAARTNWQQDSGALSAWLADFDRACAKDRLVSVARQAGELEELLAADQNERAEILLVGFDRLQPAQERLLNAWGRWRRPEPAETAREIHFYRAQDEQSELAACIEWCRAQLAKNQNARLLVVTQALPTRRGELERAFLRLQRDLGAVASFELTLGAPLAQISLLRSAYLLMKWLGDSLSEHEVDWLLGCGMTAGSAAETLALTGFLRALRKRQMERPHWLCESLLAQRPGPELPAEWAARMRQASSLLANAVKSKRSYLAWADFVPELLRAAGWSGSRPLTSEEFQVLRRWQQALDTCASLGFDGTHVAWSEFLASLGRVLDETLFAPESQDAAITIAGPAESAGLDADAIWFLGASEDAWPSVGSLHPLLPVWVQRDSAMPHAKAQIDWDLAEAVTKRLIGSAAEVHFSFASQTGGTELRESRLVTKHAGDARDLPADLIAANPSAPNLDAFVDFDSVPLVVKHVAGGAAVLSSQSQCPFKAFATTRLSAAGWEPAQAGLTASQRGNLLHEVMHSVWSPDGVRSHAELKAVADLEVFVSHHVRKALAGRALQGVRERMPQAYLALEEKRLTQLVTEWLQFERERVEFTVDETEVKKGSTIAGLSLDLRLDRIDRLNDSTYLVIDYKTGDVETDVWDLPRPEDVQLPLYSCFALGADVQPGGLVFAKIRAGQNEFVGRVFDARKTLVADGIEKKALAKKPLTEADLDAWRECIEQLAQAFLAGRAEVDPIDRKKICEHCELQTLCRITERAADEEDDQAGEEAINE